MTVDVCATGRAIGGFLPLETGYKTRPGGVLALWGATPENSWFFANARSALAQLLRQEGCLRLLLPAYICPELAASAGDRSAIAFYPVSECLAPNTEALSDMLRAGDCVVAVDYFGRPPPMALRALAAQRSEVVWVEDRAQALFPAAESWAEWALYSPRKLFGVADGGILVRRGGPVDPAVYAPAGAADRALPRLMRRDDRDETGNDAWYAAYRRVEADMTVSCEAMSCATRGVLGEIDPRPAIRRRRENFNVLHHLLPDVAFFAEPADGFAPFGFPVRLAARDRVWQALCARRIYPARYWPSLPSPPRRFAAAHALAREIMLLPCDHRYDAGDMRRVAAAFREVHR